MRHRRKMQAGDWLNGATLLVVGVFLGLAVPGLVRLAGTDFWPLAILIPVLFGSVFLFDLLLGGLINRIFSTGIKPARRRQGKERKPLVLLLSLPAGLLVGVIGAQFGLGDILL